MDETAYCLALHHIPGIGTRTFQKLLKKFGSARNIFESRISDVAAAKILNKNTLENLKKPDWHRVDKALAWATQTNNHILTLSDAKYPVLLKQIADPPPILFVKGILDLLQHNQIAQVGSRNPSPTGKETAYEFARELSNSGLIITSGLAIGIDGISHQGALDTNSPTIAVLGTGLDKVYPARHHKLAVNIAETGALVSEYALGTPPTAANFPKRNRIISGLSVGTLVIEATLKSGSLITARIAAEQGREVFAIPG